MHSDVLIVGGGLAGLACAASLTRWQIDFQLLEATDRVGGRLRTDRFDGFQLDHGLYGLPTDSPVCRQWLDFDSLRLCSFDHPMLIRGNNRWVDDSDDQASLAIPAEGIAAIPRQLADRLPAGTLHTHRSVERVGAAAVQTSDEREHRYDQLVVAAEAPAARRLIGDRVPDVQWQAITCLHFAAALPPIEQRALLLSGPAAGPALRMAVISNVAPDYAPAGQSLVTVNVVDDRDGAAVLDDPEQREAAVRKQLADWFGSTVDHWRLLRTYHIPFALPAAPQPDAAVLVDDGPVLCGDYCVAASIEGALRSGLQAAETVRRRLRG